MPTVDRPVYGRLRVLNISVEELGAHNTSWTQEGPPGSLCFLVQLFGLQLLVLVLALFDAVSCDAACNCCCGRCRRGGWFGGSDEMAAKNEFFVSLAGSS